MHLAVVNMYRTLHTPTGGVRLFVARGIEWKKVIQGAQSKKLHSFGQNQLCLRERKDEALSTLIKEVENKKVHVYIFKREEPTVIYI